MVLTNFSPYTSGLPYTSEAPQAIWIYDDQIAVEWKGFSVCVNSCAENYQPLLMEFSLSCCDGKTGFDVRVFNRKAFKRCRPNKRVWVLKSVLFWEAGTDISDILISDQCEQIITQSILDFKQSLVSAENLALNIYGDIESVTNTALYNLDRSYCCDLECESPFVLNEETCECECGITECPPGQALAPDCSCVPILEYNFDPPEEELPRPVTPGLRWGFEVTSTNTGTGSGPHTSNPCNVSSTSTASANSFTPRSASSPLVLISSTLDETGPDYGFQTNSLNIRVDGFGVATAENSQAWDYSVLSCPKVSWSVTTVTPFVYDPNNGNAIVWRGSPITAGDFPPPPPPPGPPTCWIMVTTYVVSAFNGSITVPLYTRSFGQCNETDILPDLLEPLLSFLTDSGYTSISVTRVSTERGAPCTCP